MAERLINENESVLLLPAHEVLGEPHAVDPSGLVPYTALTAAVLNRYVDVVNTAHANAGAGGNITCALTADGFTLTLTDSAEDDERSLCEPGNSVDLTDLNFDADFSGFRDAEPGNADSVYEVWRHLTFAPDVPYIIVHRVGYASDEQFAVGQEIDVYYAHTDLPVDVHADGSKQKIQQVFIPKSTSPDAITYEIAA